jgi:tyrosine-specific transport protein
MKKLLSSICMVTGTTIGGGMVMLPAIIGVYSYYSAIAILIGVWLMNIAIALVFLEANCYLPKKTSLISMSRRLLGRYGEWCAWIICLVFLYTIMCAYTVGMTEIMGGFFERKSVTIPSYYFSILSVVIMSIPLYFGMVHINLFNRFIVMGMFSAFIVLIFLIMPDIAVSNLLTVPVHFPVMALPIVFTSFGFLIIIPSIRSYLDDNIKHLKISIIVGSLIPLLIYILWVTVVMGVIPVFGEGGLQSILVQAEPVKNMSSALIFYTGNAHISFFIQIFILFAISSSFIGTSLGLYDFLADGLNISKTSKIAKIKLLMLTFLPPLMIVFVQSNLFIAALGFAGLMSTILFGLYPVMLAWSGRYIYKLDVRYRVSLNRFGFFLIIMFSFIIIGVELFSLKTNYIG